MTNHKFRKDELNHGGKLPSSVREIVPGAGVSMVAGSSLKDINMIRVSIQNYHAQAKNDYADLSIAKPLTLLLLFIPVIHSLTCLHIN